MVVHTIIILSFVQITSNIINLEKHHCISLLHTTHENIVALAFFYMHLKLGEFLHKSPPPLSLLLEFSLWGITNNKSFNLCINLNLHIAHNNDIY